MPKISIVSPVYKTEKYINKMLETIRTQTFTDFEVIFVDDGSTDNCPQILDDFAKEDKKFKVIHQKNSGASAARNNGLEHCSGEYVYIIDSDDYLEKNALELLWENAQKTSADIIYGDYYIEESNRSILKKVFDREFYTDNSNDIDIIQSAVNIGGSGINLSSKSFERINEFGGAPWRAMIRRSIISDNMIRYDESLKGLGEDILFIQNVYEHVSSVSYIQKPIYHYRMLNDSLSHGYKKDLLKGFDLVYDKEELFLKQNNKGNNHWITYYYRIIKYINLSLKYYFQNKGNTSSDTERFNEFKRTMRSYPYKTAIKSVPLKLISSKNNKISVLLLKMHMYRLFWMLKKRKNK